MINVAAHQPFQYDLEDGARESHALSRTRHIPVGSIQELDVVLAALYVEGFTGQLQIDMSQGGFSHVMTKESIRLVPNADICSTIK